MNILKSTWFTHIDKCIGIIKCRNGLGEVVYYIGVGAGLDEKADAKYITEHGAKFDPAMIN